MRIVVPKLFEVLARAVFTVAATFALPLADAGRFGIIVTLIGLFAFGIGWERYIDLQRRLVGASPHVFDHAVKGAWRMWAVNYVVMVPVFVALTAVLAHVGPWELLLCVVILASEQISTTIYNLAVVEPRYRYLLSWIAARNLLLVPLIAYPILWPVTATFDYVLLGWAVIAGASSLVLLPAWLMRMDHRKPEAPLPVATGVLAQHRASLTHFGLGILAILSLQIDRLVVGGLLPLDDVGIYFRHVLLVSFAYQFFNIASYNRYVPVIFGRAQTHDVSDAERIVRMEQIKVVGVVAAGFLAGVLIDYLTGGVWTARFSLYPKLAFVLVAGALVRILADYRALILNSRMRETWVLRSQLIAFSIGSLLLVGLTTEFGMYGAAFAMLATSTLYLLLNTQRVARLRAETRAAAA